MSAKVRKLEEQLLRSNNVVRDMTEQLKRLQEAQVEQKGAFLEPGPAAPQPPQVAYLPYQPQYQAGPPHHPVVGEAGQHMQMPQGHPFAPVNKYYTFFHSY